MHSKGTVQCKLQCTLYAIIECGKTSHKAESKDCNAANTQVYLWIFCIIETDLFKPWIVITFSLGTNCVGSKTEHIYKSETVRT